MTAAKTAHTLLIANPSSDVYGSDLQMLETVTAMTEAGWRVVVSTPDDGPLIDLLTGRGAEVIRPRYPVLRRENASVRGMARLIADIMRSLPVLYRTIRQVDPDVVLVNTVTLPWWLLGSRLMGRPTVGYVHEAELGDSRPVKLALNGPLVFAHRLIVISPSSLQAVTETVKRLGERSRMIFNGVPEPTGAVEGVTRREGPRRIAIVGRLSPRKGTDVALDTVGLLRAGGRDVVLEVCGTAFAGYEWFTEQLHERATRPDLAGAVTFSGYVNPVWPVLAEAEVVLAPSLREPFGNAVVEAQLAQRPVVAAAEMGHLVSVQDGETGLLVPAGDAAAAAAAVARLLDDPAEADRIAATARRRALERFSVERYRAEVVELMTEVRSLGRRRRRRR
ncbi:glycosyltransferase family 4 protein [Nakamurella flava]|uniref:Glycosyltransferase family 4 protein n=1 Tax=Nakamurella flava TaxID=2576308 RepID=A0A4U6QMQ5_9ACTN|nr:glycosyltransferase family 4 protein [Nakamurella flava]TKV61711.1 glycosyltransferase family 4 protein [Nakamurella flava]